jgi:hypothetical protein
MTEVEIDNTVVRAIAKQYNTLDYPKRLRELLSNIYPFRSLTNSSKYELHKLMNDLLLDNHSGEQIHKYLLSKEFLHQKNIIGAFEIKVNNSRADFLTINGHTTSFEIKSEFDNLSKLEKQIGDYLLAFEYNYLIVDECHLHKVLDKLPDNYGLWVYKGGKYIKNRKAKLNLDISPNVQLSLLTSAELKSNFSFQSNVKKILKNYSPYDINIIFKKALKERYKVRWQFLAENNESILPIDTQFFFNTNVKPQYIYC